MTEQELISMVIDEITEHKLSHYRMKNKDIINLYIAKHAALADKDCAFLYEQGVKDCVKLLKRLGVL